MQKILILIFLLSFVLSPATTFAVSGKNVKNKYVEVQTRQGGEWFTARKVKTDDKSSLRLKGVIPGKYIFKLDDDDIKSGQTLGLELRMKDDDGKQLREKTKVDAYIYIGDTKVFINTFKTKDNGYLNLTGVTPGMTYELKVKGDGKTKKREGTARIKTKAKIDGSDWFKSSYDRLYPDESGLTNGILEMGTALPGKYKFKLKSGDPYDPTKSFTIKARMRKDNGKKIKKPTQVNVYAYPNGIKTKIAEVMTDAKGWIILPGAQPDMKYRLKVKD